ncbi:(ZYRO0D08030g) [Zygosaccharomyces parabailii]|nr:(ZYRO0D08030g) [Zygosaccharomyces parabailii]
MWLLTMFMSLFPIICSYVVVNRYFSFKLHKNTYFLPLLILMLNMVILLFTTYLLPLDIFYGAKASLESASTSADPTTVSARDVSIINGTNVVQHNFDLLWRFIYWLEFILCWFVIPVLISYISLKYACVRQQGPHSSRSQLGQRLALAVYQNTKFYMLCLLGLFVGLVYLVSSTGHGLSDFKPLLISLAHLYSLSYMLILLSTGLIIFPKNLFGVVRSPKNETINRLFVELSKTNDDLNDSQLNMLENAERILHSSEIPDQEGFNDMLNQCKMEVQSLLNEQKLSVSNFNAVSTSGATSITTLEKLNSHYNKFITHYYNYLHNQTHSNGIIHILAQSQSLNSSSRHWKNIIITVVAVISTTLSVLIAYLEITPNKWGHAWVFDGTHWYNFGLEFVLFSYNTLVALYAMSKFKFNNFHLIPNGRSNPTNALYYSLYSSRLLFPLCFNLMVLIPSGENASSDSMNSSFAETLYTSLIRIPLANYLNRVLPPIFMVFILVSYRIDLKQKILLRILGEEYYYQFFGMMMYEPAPEGEQEAGNTSSASLFFDNESPLGQRSRMDEDYEYSLQDGRYLFERASRNHGVLDENDNGSLEQPSSYV